MKVTPVGFPPVYTELTPFAVEVCEVLFGPMIGKEVPHHEVIRTINCPPRQFIASDLRSWMQDIGHREVTLPEFIELCRASLTSNPTL